jgi:hypothetical protein
MKKTNEELQEYLKFSKDPLYFIEIMWGLVPQPIKEQYLEEVTGYIKNKQYDEIRNTHFKTFLKGKHITWQQWLILLAVRDAVNNNGKRRISIASGHGIGKSCVLAMILIWFLYSHYLSQIACTAPSKEQMYDVLWKELSRWIGALPSRIKNQFDIQTSHIRIVEKPMEWFARAKTAKKDAPEALAGVHGDDVLLLVDEASGVADEIYETAEGSMTNENYVMILISNPTRLDGKFFKSHNDDTIKHRWQRFVFSSEESPVVEADYCVRKLEENGGNRDADDYRIRVRGMFPRADSVDDKGYTALLMPQDIREIPDVANQDFIAPVLMGIDPAGEGTNKTTWVIRDRFKAKVVLREEVSNEKKIAQKTLTLMEVFKVKAENIWVDNFGTGANVAKELALAGVSVNGINVGDRCHREKDRETYLNVRAQNYFRLKTWLRSGGELIQDKIWQEQFKSIRFRRALTGKIQIMSKLDMRRAGYNSPDEVDALMLTFTREDNGAPVRTITGSGQVINHDRGITLENSQQKENLSVFDAI